jgi:hypothetical protein
MSHRHLLRPRWPGNTSNSWPSSNRNRNNNRALLGCHRQPGLAPISMQLKKLPSVLNVPQMHISSNSNLRPLANPGFICSLEFSSVIPTRPPCRQQRLKPALSPHHLTDRRNCTHPPLLLHHENFHKDSPCGGLFLHRVHYAQMSLGPWEGCIVVFVLGATFILSALI